MTSRLENAIKQLLPADLARVEHFAEALVHHANATNPQYLQLNWAGRIDSPHRSGLEAQEAAKQAWLDAIEQNLS